MSKHEVGDVIAVVKRLPAHQRGAARKAWNACQSGKPDQAVRYRGQRVPAREILDLFPLLTPGGSHE